MGRGSLVIYTFIPYSASDDPDLGAEYNRFMGMLPGDEDWACFIDHDAMFTTRHWYRQLADVIQLNPNAGCFTAKTNRVGNYIQVVDVDLATLNIFSGRERRRKHLELLNNGGNNHDIAYHRQKGQQLHDSKRLVITQLPEEYLLSGVLLLVRKGTWRQVPFRSGFFGVDAAYHYDCIKAGYRVYLMEGVYVYHWYRGDADVSHFRKFPAIKVR
jgi:GT2 family glycosyltransferase